MGCTSSSAACVHEALDNSKVGMPAGAPMLLGRTSRDCAPEKLSARSLEESIQQYHFRTIKEGGCSRYKFIAEEQGDINDFYTFEGQSLGEGSFGSVRKAVHKHTQAERAVKKICKQEMEENEQFIQEIAIIKSMDHPHIVKLYESFDDGQFFYLTMEVCSGGELFDQILELGSGFSECQSAVVSQQMLQAVLYMHHRQICHRDLKPENFLLQSQVPLEDSVLKLIDFGLACPFRSDPFTTVCGSAFYIAPEVIAKSYGAECDVWSTGIIIYILICGYPPFQGANDKATMKAVSKNKLVFPKAEWSNVSSVVREFISKLLMKKPCARLSIENAAAHPWLKSQAPQQVGQILNMSMVRNLRAFRSQHRLKQAAMQTIAGSLKEEQIDSLRKAFKALDDNGDGLLSTVELQRGIDTAGLQGLVGVDAQCIMDDVDADGSGFIDYTEFLAAALDERVYKKESVCWEAFCTFDRDHDGKISMADLRVVLSDEDENGVISCNIESLMSMMKDVDGNGDGEIDFEEFLSIMRS